MKLNKGVVALAGVALVFAAAASIYLAAKRKPATALVKSVGNPSTKPTQVPPPDPTQIPTNFLGTLAPGGTAESAGHERNYIVTYQVVFLRKTPDEKLPEESLSYQDLQQRDPSSFAPCVFYGQSVSGTYDPTHPESIAIHATIDDKQVRGYVDAKKLWLEPSIAPVDTPQYMALRDGTTVHVVPDSTSPPVLNLFQGEMVRAIGKLDFQGRQWIKAGFLGEGVVRYGFIQAPDMQALTVATVNQSVLTTEEVPHRSRYSNLSLAELDRQQLSRNGFYIESVPPEQQILVDDMADAYSGEQQPFVTSDLFLHAYHLIFDRMLQDVEEKKLSPAISHLSANLVQATESEIKTLPPGMPADLRDALTYDLCYFSVAAQLFDPNFAVPDDAAGDTEAIVGRIQKADGELPAAARSKFGDEDFTQYRVRGHYERNETLQRYFKAMMWYGRRNFYLADRRMTLAAILIPGLLDRAQQARTFESIDSSLEYLVGPQDKSTLAGYRAVNKKVFGTETPTATQVAAKLDDNLKAFSDAAAGSLPPPQIASVQTGMGKTQEERLKMVRGFKFLGQRYTLDAFLLNQMTSPNVGTDQDPRNLPSALDVMMILGSHAAAEQQQEEQQRQKWANYDSQAKKLEGIAQDHLAEQATFYDEWLNTVNSLFLPIVSKQAFALGKPWQYKNLNAGAASWTELKHDTILYAEQSAAEMGAGEEFEIPPYAPPGPKGYVEPNPAFFERLGRSIDGMLGRMKRTGFITDEYVDKFTTLRELARTAGTLARKEVSGAPITEDDYAWIGNLREQFNEPLLLPRGADEISDRSELQMALIADVATDAVEGRVLEVATGTPQRITVVVKDAYGGTRLTIGYVYSWYEFPSNKRWADSEWKKIVYTEGGTARKQSGVEPPSWYSTFVKNAGGGN
ncbi:MAG TPA: DUF3160 domain-containing protein [Candidatus Acidoferrales bacterium]|nr:DUF3160 domain-containing protein [Candidatus Acidoferrales bacterium]